MSNKEMSSLQFVLFLSTSTDASVSSNNLLLLYKRQTRLLLSQVALTWYYSAFFNCEPRVFNQTM